MPKISPFLNFRTTFKTNLTCILLSVGLKLLSKFQYEMPCSKNPIENRGLISFEFCKHVHTSIQIKRSFTNRLISRYSRLIKKIKKHRKEYFLIILIWVYIVFFYDFPPLHRRGIYRLHCTTYKIDRMEK